MAGTAKKWFIGCGIGCGVMLLLVLGLGTAGYFGIKGAIDRGENIEASFEQLEAEYGAPGEYTPDPALMVAADRMDVFLGIREEMAPQRKAMGDLLRTLDGQEVDGRKPGGLAKAKAGFRLIPDLMDFIGQRSRTLLEGGMGLGEYLYIYSLSYPVLLEKDLQAGPGFTLASEGDDEENGGFHWRMDPDAEGSLDVKADRELKIRTYLHRIQLKMARNQLAALQATGGDEAGAAALEAEIGRMESETRRLLWETDMPESLRRSLEPYRDRLEAQYDPMVNILESGLVEAE